MLNLTALTALVDRAGRQVSAAKYFWGIIAASSVVAINSQLNGLNKLTFVAIIAAFVALFIFYVFSRLERAQDRVVRLAGYSLLIASSSAFIFVILTSAWLAVTCTPRLIAFLYGVSEVCYPAAPIEKKTELAPSDKKTESATALYRDFVRRDGIWEGVDQISAEEAAHLSASYEFTLSAAPARTILVRKRNGAGFCPTEGFSDMMETSFRSNCSVARACASKFSYKQDGSVDRQEFYDQFGNILEELQYPSVVSHAKLYNMIDAGYAACHVDEQRGVSGNG